MHAALKDQTKQWQVTFPGSSYTQMCIYCKQQMRPARACSTLHGHPEAKTKQITATQVFPVY